ncbi:hypothetical protein CTAYLR_009550 [Chrysophaeum taylorii]|uniref:TAP42-like protein n=1 Tax=Chrysophaeum taylorii TaxID=2483200 RepID=A0AAD7UIN6_9STRA|nr:hypothetical protein CTAYLR_009550 [Chrysophaeum taylorii]
MELRRAVADGRERLETLERFGSSSPASEAAEKCVEILEKATASIRSIFVGVSSADDVADGDLECALAPFYLSRALQRLRVEPTPAARLGVAKRARAATREFLSLVERLDVFGDDERREWEDDYSTATTPAAARAEAIKRHERQQATRLKLEALDDADPRDKIVFRLLEASQTALDDLRLADREIEMLELVSGDPPKPEPRRITNDADWLRAAEDGKGLRVLRVAADRTVSRDRVKAAVFSPDPRRLPTVSLEEAADRELRDALRRQAASSSNNNQPDLRRTKQLEDDGDDDDEDAYDAATKRDEAWDTWREHHPRGSGNKGDNIY